MGQCQLISAQWNRIEAERGPWLREEGGERFHNLFPSATEYSCLIILKLPKQDGGVQMKYCLHRVLFQKVIHTLFFLCLLSIYVN